MPSDDVQGARADGDLPTVIRIDIVMSLEAQQDVLIASRVGHHGYFGPIALLLGVEIDGTIDGAVAGARHERVAGEERVIGAVEAGVGDLLLIDRAGGDINHFEIEHVMAKVCPEIVSFL